jgi:predicted RNase H-like HicB family nuclease
MRYLIIIEETGTGFSAYSPDLPGCVSTGKTEEAVVANMREAIAFHIDGLKADDLPVPAPASRSSWVEVAA